MKTSLKTPSPSAAFHTSLVACTMAAAAVTLATANAQNNTKTEAGAGSKITSGKHNTANGFRALNKSKTGNFNTAIGSNALAATTGSSNTALGYQALFKNKVGAFNVALGDGALLNNRTGSGNIGIGEDGGFNITGSNNICIGHKGIANQNGIIRIGTNGTHSATFIAGVITGDGSGLTGVTIPAASISGGIAGGKIVNNSIHGSKLAPNLALGGTTTGTFSGNVSAPVLTSGFATISNANGSASFNPSPEALGANLVGTLTGATQGAQLRFQKSGSTDFIDVGQNGNEDFVVEGNDVARLVVRKSGNVGLGVNVPNSKLHVDGDGVLAAFRVQNFGVSKLTVAPNGGTSIGAFQNTPPTDGLYVSGNVGIGTAAPSSKLEVRGDIKMGPSGQFQALAGTEKLRLLRGYVGSSGNINDGSGFTINKLGTGNYRINYDVDFTSFPTLIVTTEDSSVPEIATVSTQGLTSSVVKIWTTGGVARDSAFHFIVVGTR